MAGHHAGKILAVALKKFTGKGPKSVIIYSGCHFAMYGFLESIVLYASCNDDVQRSWGLRRGLTTTNESSTIGLMDTANVWRDYGGSYMKNALGYAVLTGLAIGFLVFSFAQQRDFVKRIHNLEEQLNLLVATMQNLKKENQALKTELEAVGYSPLTVYFIRATSTDFLLEPVVKQVPRQKCTPQTAMEELLKGPGSSKDLMPGVPKGTKLRRLYIEGDTAFVDLSEEIIRNFEGGARLEQMTLMSIVNTLTEFEQIKRVQLLVEGNVVETIGGHMGVFEPVRRDANIIMQ
ncbi:MAG: GerMN domain-containing protein [Limnochordia bacterium]|nr:GerMN domain-containing protein [Limnochordia bacterium]